MLHRKVFIHHALHTAVPMNKLSQPSIMSPERTFTKAKYEADQIRTRDPPFVGYIALPTCTTYSHVTMEQV